MQANESIINGKTNWYMYANKIQLQAPSDCQIDSYKLHPTVYLPLSHWLQFFSHAIQNAIQF